MPFTPKEFMADWDLLLVEQEEAEQRQVEYMSPEQILLAFDGMIDLQNQVGKVVRK